MPTAAVAYPILFTINDALASMALAVRAQACGRALMVQEDDGVWWFYGVEPGGIAEHGDTPQIAFLRFTESFKKVLCEIAESSNSFNALLEEADRFFHQADREEEARWRDAVEALRSGELKTEGDLETMARQPAQQALFISITPLHPREFSGASFDSAAMAAAAA